MKMRLPVIFSKFLLGPKISPKELKALQEMQQSEYLPWGRSDLNSKVLDSMKLNTNERAHHQMLVCRINFVRTDEFYNVKFRCRRNMTPKKVRIPIGTMDLTPYASELCQHISDYTAIIPVALRDYQIFQLINIINSQILCRVTKSSVTFDLEMQKSPITVETYSLPTIDMTRNSGTLSFMRHAQELLR